MLRDAVVEQRHGEQQGVGLDELVDEGGGEGPGVTLGLGALVFRHEGRGDRVAPCRGGDDVGADVPADDVLARVGLGPGLLDDVTDRPAVRALDTEAGVQSEESHGACSTTSK